MIMENIPREALLLPFTLLVLTFVLRTWVVWLREQVGYHAGGVSALPSAIRSRPSATSGPAWIRVNLRELGDVGTRANDDMHDFYARYLPQMALAVSVPF